VKIMVDEELIGVESRPVSVKVTAERVRRFTEAIGVPFDGTVPPTFIITMLDIKIPGLELPLEGAIHGEQKFIYHRPLQIGDTITYTTSIKQVYHRQGKLGKMTFVSVETKGYNLAREQVFAGISTVIIPRKGDE
jgi:acyl dehydratase